MIGTKDLIDDTELIVLFKVKQSRERAFKVLVEKYRQRLYWHIRRMVIVHTDADDVIQNVFIKVWKNLDGFREESNLYTWLYRIATNESLAWIARQKKFSSVSIDAEDDFVLQRLQADRDFDPKKIEWKLQQAVATLPEKQRTVFNLRYFDEMPYVEMSEVLETSVGALKASYHHAVKKVEDYIKAG